MLTLTTHEPQQIVFCAENDPFDTVDWETRSAQIKGEKGELIFEQTNCEVPSTWSQLATNIVCSKYFYGELGSSTREYSVKQLIHRVARTIADWGLDGGYFETKEQADDFYRELAWLCLHQYGAFNSPVWFNVGLYHQYGIKGSRSNWVWNESLGDVCRSESSFENPQGSACFIQSVDDTMESIMNLATSEAMLFKFGSGTGTDLSTIRSSRELLSGGGTPSGPLSFMRVYDQIAAIVRSGGKTRRAAKMQSLRVEHPDIMEFIECKWKEEKKAHALIKQGYESNFNGEAYSSIMYQNANLSVRVTDDFMRAVENDKEWTTTWVTDNTKPGPKYKARDVMNRMAECAWHCGDPGVQYHSTINKWHPCPESGEIRASNPCCFTADTFVHTNKGLVRFGELVKRAGNGGRFEVYTDGKASKKHSVVHGGVLVGRSDTKNYVVAYDDDEGEIVTEYQRGTNGGSMPSYSEPANYQLYPEDDVYEIELWRGMVVRANADHKFWTTNRGWVSLENLTADDDVAVVNSVNRFNTDYSWSFDALRPYKGNRQKIDLPTEWTQEFAEFLGWLTGDGCFTNIKDGIGFYVNLIFNSDELDVFNRLRPHLVQWNGGDTVHTERSWGIVTRYGSGPFMRILADLGYKPVKAHEKDVPDAIFQAPKDIIANFLRGYFGADGNFYAESDCSHYSLDVGSASKQLLQKIQLLLSMFGIESRIRFAREGGSTAFSHVRKDGTIAEYESKDSWRLTVYRHCWNTFATEIGFSAAHKQQSLESFLSDHEGEDWEHPKTPNGVVRRDYIGKMPVYNLEEPTNNSYAVNGLLVANSEYMYLDDTACNLASVNLMKFRKSNGEIDVERYQAACRIFFTAQEILVDNASYPTEAIARNSHKHRPLGLGYTNLGSYLMSIGLPYDSPKARGICGALTAIMHGAANLTSSDIAERMGAFEEYDKNQQSFVCVMHMHRDAAYNITDCPAYLVAAAQSLWDDVVSHGEQHGYRNAQATVLAPTGTISFMMDCDTTGIEPDIALVKYKQLAGGGMLKIVNQTVPMALASLGYSKSLVKSIMDYIEEHDTIEGAPGLKNDDLAVFDCAFEPRNGKRSIKWQAHVKMMAAAQPFLSGAISKTVNMPRESTPEDIAKAYIDGWKLGLKALAIYRDGSKESQPLSTSTESAKAKEQQVAKPIRRRLPDTRTSITHKFDIAGHEGYITVGLYPDGTPGELFIKVAKEGSTVSGLMDVIGTVVSMGLQYGVPLQVYIDKFTHVRFEPQGFTKHPQIRIAKSLVDYIFRWLEITFPNKEEPAINHETNVHLSNGHSNNGHASNGHFSNGHAPKESEVVARNQQDSPPCDKCGSITYRNGACYLCYNCGTSAGCS